MRMFYEINEKIFAKILILLKKFDFRGGYKLIFNNSACKAFGNALS